MASADDKITKKELSLELNTFLGSLASSTDLQNHTKDTNIHVTPEDRKRWDAGEAVKGHAEDKAIHVSKEDRQTWDGKANKDDVKTIVNNSISNLVNNTTTDQTSPIKQYIDKGDFLNFSPKVGFLDEKQATISSAYNSSYYCGEGYKVISDSEGREVIYFTASSGPEEVGKVFKASRMSTNDQYVFRNQPVKAKYMGANDYIYSIIGLDSYSITYFCRFNGKDEHHIAVTNGTSNSDKWTEYINISTITKFRNVINASYFKEYETIAIIFDENGSVFIEVYNKLNMQLLKRDNLFDAADIKFSNDTVIEYLGKNSIAAAYDIYNKRLVVYAIKWTVGKLSAGGHFASYINYTQIIKVPPTYFVNGTGLLEKLISPALYDLCVPSKGWTSYIDGVLGGFDSGGSSLIYDDYDSVLRYSHRWQPGIQNIIVTNNVKVTPVDTYKYAFSDVKKIEYSIPPDACPWAKYQRSAIVMCGNIYMRAGSQKYGESVIGADYILPSSSTDRKVKVKGGTWWLSSAVEDPGVAQTSMISLSKMLQCQVSMLSKTNARYLYLDLAGNGKVYEFISTSFTGKDGKTYNGKRILNETSLPPITDIQTKYKYFQSIYNHVNNKYYHIVADKVSADPNLQDYFFIIEQDVSSGKIVEHRLNEMPIEWVQCFDNSKSALNSSPIGIVGSNCLVNYNGDMYISLCAETVGDRAWYKMYKISITSGFSMKAIKLLANNTPWCGFFISYDPKFGYCVTTGYFDSYATIFCSKDTATGAEYTIDDFFLNAKSYQLVFGLSGAVGLIANVQEAPMFLGGYYSVVPAQEVGLYPNADNYVYFVRDRYDRFKINVEVRTKIVGVEGETSFNRALVTKITTNDTDPIKQVDYNIG